MKLVIYAFSASIGIHAIYYLIIMLKGFFKTKAYVPDISVVYNQPKSLDSEVSFGISTKRKFNLSLFLAVTLISGVAIYLIDGWSF